jgi:methylmalonyl-CoA/ethylmalonyl-CoA epimerase
MTPASPGLSLDRRLALRIHHVGYAVASISEYLNDFGAELFERVTVSPIVEDPIQRVRVAFVELPGGTLELVEPMTTDSPVQNILARKRGGLYHVAYATPRFEEATRAAIARGYRLVAEPAPAAAFENRRIVFLMTPHFDLVELIEMPDSPAQ